MADNSITDSSQAAVEIIRVCQDGMRFRVFGGLQLPEYGFVRPPRALPPPYLVHLVVADGVPTREGAARDAGPDAWVAGIIRPREAIVRPEVETARARARKKEKARARAEEGQPATQAQLKAAEEEAEKTLRDCFRQELENVFRQELKNVLLGGEAWLKYGVDWDKGTKPLNPPDPDYILLDQQFSVPSAWLLDVQFPQETEPNPVCFLSEPYPRPTDLRREALWGRRVRVSHYGEYTLGWTREPKIDTLLSISFEGFAPKRDSADIIAPVTPGRLFRGPDL